MPASAGRGLKRYAIFDRHRDFAGTIALDDGWYESQAAEETQEFIAISDAREFDEREYAYWNLYIGEDQSIVPWQLYNVLMIVRDGPNRKQKRQGDNVAYRRGLGKIYKKAFDNACSEKGGEAAPEKAWKEIILG